MQRMRDDFFSATVFAGNQDVCIRGTNPCDGFENGLHRGGRGDELWTALGMEKTVLSGQSFGAQERTMQFDLRAEDRKEALVVPGFLYEVPRSSPHGFDRQFYISPGGHHDDGKIAVGSDDFGKKVKAFLSGGGVSRIVQVDQHSVVGVGSEHLTNLSGRFDAIDAVALRMKQQFQRFQNVLLIVSGEDPGRAALAWIER